MTETLHAFATAPRRSPFSKVPEVTAIFWVVKILTTGMGETTSDFLAHHIYPPIAVLIGLVGLVAAMALQLAAPRYNAWSYWLAMVMVSVFGTMAADVLHVGFGIPYIASTMFFALSLAVIFWLWHRTEGTLAIHSIHSHRRELFYWATVLATFALGTAAGDMTATSLGLGYLDSGFLFAGVIALPALAFWKLGLPEVPAFWFAYIVTRPLGASFADWMGVNHQRGGLDWGTGPVSLGLFALIVVLVGYLALTRSDVEPETH
ncbi:COG4705 family protein [Acidimangrovimonas pyrenivorans]|uniref:Membrane-anchored protein n=1 Tax=Acidimangrovimonas pyrenivorans TaxID=2030798 RepID=A0ABV7AF30_9RHOB